MKVVEIFDSIDGEGIFAGTLATFIRLAGCNLRCGYCDTSYALRIEDGEEMSIAEILAKVENIGNKHITLTGGEPLIHNGVKELIHALCTQGYIVNIETNGSIDIADYQEDNVVVTMDYKTISSDMNTFMNQSNFQYLREQDILKIVCQESDFDDIEKLLQEQNLKCYIYLSPIFDKVEPAKLVDFLKKLRCDGINVDKARVQLQIHKIIWDKELRGV